MTLDRLQTFAARHGLVLAAFAIVALLRVATLAPDPWEWDELLFTRAVRDGLDVRRNAPHAPGYPVFVRAGRVLAAAGVEPFRAATLAGATGGFLAVAGAYALFLALGARRPFALLGAMLFGLTPSLWLHGVRPLSDGPAAAAGLFAAAFVVRALARGRGRDLVAAAALSALAAGVRPQVGLALLPAAAFAAWAVWRETRRVAPLALAVAVGLAVSALVWLPTFASSGGFVEWKRAFDAQMAFVRHVDSPSARTLATAAFWKRWLFDPVGGPRVGWSFWILALLGAAAFGRRAGRLVLVLGPVAALTVGVLAAESAPRYAMAFWALPCGLVAFAFEAAAARPRLASAVRPVAALLLAALSFVGVPAIVEVATRPSPPVAAISAIASDPARRGKPLFLDEALQVHAEERLGPDGWRLLDGWAPERIPANGVLVWRDRPIFGVEPRRTFAFRERARLARISRNRYVETSIYDGADGAAYHVPAVVPPGWYSESRGTVALADGATLTVLSASDPVAVSFRVRIAAGGARLRVETPERRADFDLPAGTHPIAFPARPDPKRRLFAVTSVRGRATLDAFRLLATDEPVGRGYRRDDGILASVDDPVAGTRQRAPLFVRGWCQERGGGRVDPVEFRVDSFLVPNVVAVRVPRPDVASAIPEIGDASAAGWEARIPADLLAPGRHVLVVVFQAGDRRRLYPARAFEIAP